MYLAEIFLLQQPFWRTHPSSSASASARVWTNFPSGHIRYFFRLLPAASSSRKSRCRRRQVPLFVLEVSSTVYHRVHVRSHDSATRQRRQWRDEGRLCPLNQTHRKKDPRQERGDHDAGHATQRSSRGAAERPRGRTKRRSNRRGFAAVGVWQGYPAEPCTSRRQQSAAASGDVRRAQPFGTTHTGRQSPDLSVLQLPAPAAAGAAD
jgi:hypothetical protein